MNAVYRTSALKPKRLRSTNADLAELDALIYKIAKVEHPMTIRGAFYRVMSAGGVPKTEAGYGKIQRRILIMRRSGRLPYGWFKDGSRLSLRPATHDDMDEALDACASAYRRMLWNDQKVHVEVWSEKDAIRSTVWPVTAQWHVPLMIARGFSSETFLYETAEDIVNLGKPAVIYQLGDHDPSGVAAWDHIQRKLREFAPGVDFTFERLAVTEEQIDEYDLPTRPTKQSDSRAAGFEGESVEVDAIPSPTLRRLVRKAIEGWIDKDALRLTREVEKQERDILHSIANDYDWSDA